MSRKKRTEHCVMSTKVDNAFECLRCGETYLLSMPCSINMFLATAKAFACDHQRCKPKKAK